MQAFTSAATSINSNKLPKVYGKLPPLGRNSLLLDYGCGRYTDHIRAALDVVYLPYDPFNQPEAVNQQSLALVRIAQHIHMPVTIVCSNVLNVINDDDAIQAIANRIQDIVQCSGGTAYITVYAGDRSGIGRQTGPDQWQRNEPLRNYLRFFRSATIRNNMIIIGGN